MESNFNGALESISIIKKSINKGKANLKVIYKLFLINAIIITFKFLFESVLSEIFLAKGGIELYSRFSYITTIIVLIMNGAFLIYYLKTYKEEKHNSNKYYITFLSLFGVMKFFIPLVIRVSYAIKPKNLENYNNSDQLLNLIYFSLGIVSIIFLYLSLNLLGEILEKRSYKLLSLFILAGYFSIAIFSGDSNNVININEVFRAKFYLNIYLNLFTLISSLIIPISIKIEERKNYGNK